MSVLIKGMEMPKKCNTCPCCDDLGCAVKLTSMTTEQMNKKRPDWCPLVELPEKHGRLIDADAFFSRLSGDDFEFSFHVDGVFVDVSKMNKILRNQPTVIESEGE